MSGGFKRRRCILAPIILESFFENQRTPRDACCGVGVVLRWAWASDEDVLCCHHRARGTGNTEKILLQITAPTGIRGSWAESSLSLWEIDLLVQDRDLVVCVEVKTRKKIPCEVWPKAQQERLRKAAMVFLDRYDLLGYSCRFDLITVWKVGEKWILRHQKNVLVFDDF